MDFNAIWLSIRTFLARLVQPNRVLVYGPPAPRPPIIDALLALSSTQSLVLGAVVDFLLGYIVVALLMLLMGSHPPFGIQLLLALVIGAPKYLWSVDMFKNKVQTYEMGVITFLQKIISSGPDGRGLLPGYYWLPLGRPFFLLAIKQNVKEITIEFKNMQVWPKNSAAGIEGAIQAEVDGIAQFQIDDPAAYNSIPEIDKLLTTFTLECARDAVEEKTIEQFVSVSNDHLGNDTYNLIKEKIRLRNLMKPIGVKCLNVTIGRTDNKDAVVKAAWAQIPAARSTATARQTDADARVIRINNYGNAGVDRNRAAAVDLVANGAAGASVDDRRFNLDVGESLRGVGEGLVGAIARRVGGQ